MNRPQITAVIPAFNAELFISEAIDSLLNQTVPCHEIIVIDDASQDGTRKQVNYFLDEVKLISLAENQGASHARNTGVLEAEGDLILFMDADDVAEPNLVEQLLNKLSQLQQDESNNKWVLIHSAYRQIDSQGKFIGDIQRFKQVGFQEILGYQFIRNHVYLSGTLVKREAFLRVGGFNEQLTHAEDWDLWLRLAQVGGYGYIDESLFRVRRHDSNVSKDIQHMLAGERKVLSQYSLDFIRKAIEQRELPNCENQLDFVNILFRMDLWLEGYRLLKQIVPASHQALNKYFFLEGIYLYREKCYQDALYCFNQALKYNEYDGASLNNLAVVSAQLRKFEKSQHLLETVLTLLPNYMDALHNLNVIRTNKCLDKLKLTWRQLRPVLIAYETINKF